MADILIGNVKGPQGEQGVAGVQGEQGEAATIEVGTVTTVPYGQTASVVNSGTESEAVFDFTIPQGRPGEQVTDMQNLTLGSITTSAAEFPIPAVGETGKVLWGKVVKWFSDMAALVATKFDAANVVNNVTTTASGYALDARQGKTLNDAINNQVIVSRTSESVTIGAGAAVYHTATVPNDNTYNWYLIQIFTGSSAVRVNDWGMNAVRLVSVHNTSLTLSMAFTWLGIKK